MFHEMKFILQQVGDHGPKSCQQIVSSSNGSVDQFSGTRLEVISSSINQTDKDWARVMATSVQDG
jgi:hypothetical protein